jgi:hypothetical protein
MYQTFSSSVVNVKRYRCKTSATSLPALCKGSNFSLLPLPLESASQWGLRKKVNPSMLENARLLGVRWLAEEALERNLLSYKSICIYFMKTSFPMTRMIDHTSKKSAMLKLPKLVT